MNGRPDHPDLPIKPPLIFVLATAIGALLHVAWPRAARPDGWGMLGAALAALAVVLLAWCSRLFQRHQTEIVPWKPTRVIVDYGPYGVSRNPIYVAFALFQLGLGLWADKLAVVLMTLPALVATHYLVVVREEAYLERKFGDAYRDYMRRVRRWV